MFFGCSEISKNVIVNICATCWKLSGLFSAWEDLLSFSVPWRTEIIT